MYYLPNNRTFWNYSGIGLLLLLLIISMLTFSSAIGMVMSKYYHLGFATFLKAVQGKMGYSYTNIARLYNFLSFLGFMLFPSLLLLTINRTRLKELLSFRKPGFKQMSISVLLIILAIPIGMYLVFLMEGFAWPALVKSWANALNTGRESQFKLLLRMGDIWDLFICLGLLAVLPAFCEELLFRGITQPILMHKTGKVWLPIILQALVFSMLHFSFYEFFTIFGLGILLGVIAYRYGILMSMVAHFTFNSTSIIAEYLSQKGMQEAQVFSSNNYAPSLLLSLLGLLLIIFIITKKTWVKL